MMLHGINQSIDVIVPRGGKSLSCQWLKKKHEFLYLLILKVYVISLSIKSADQEKALNVCLNAKMRRPGICGAVETILVHSDIADDFMPSLVNAL